QRLFLEGSREGASAALSDELIDAMAIATTPSGLDDRLAAFAAAGADTLVVVPLGEREALVRTLADAMRGARTCPATAARGHPRLRGARAVAGRPVRRGAARPAARLRARAGLRRGVRAEGGPDQGVLGVARQRRGAAVLDVAKRLGCARGDRDR